VKKAATITATKANPIAAPKAQAKPAPARRPEAPARAPRRRRGPANIFGADPHKHTLTATVLDCRGGALGARSFRVPGEGHRAMEAWALGFGPVERGGHRGRLGPGPPHGHVRGPART
jgi:hypothetical protein